jgi:hypothetical protein
VEAGPRQAQSDYVVENDRMCGIAAQAIEARNLRASSRPRTVGIAPAGHDAAHGVATSRVTARFREKRVADGEVPRFRLPIEREAQAAPRRRLPLVRGRGRHLVLAYVQALRLERATVCIDEAHRALPFAAYEHKGRHYEADDGATAHRGSLLDLGVCRRRAARARFRIRATCRRQ